MFSVSLLLCVRHLRGFITHGVPWLNPRRFAPSKTPVDRLYLGPLLLGSGVWAWQGDAPVAELVDALDSGSSGRKLVEVRVLSGALKEN